MGSTDCVFLNLSLPFPRPLVQARQAHTTLVALPAFPLLSLALPNAAATHFHSKVIIFLRAIGGNTSIYSTEGVTGARGPTSSTLFLHKLYSSRQALTVRILNILSESHLALRYAPLFAIVMKD